MDKNRTSTPYEWDSLVTRPSDILDSSLGDLSSQSMQRSLPSQNTDMDVAISNAVVGLSVEELDERIRRPDGSTDGLWEQHKETIIRLYWEQDMTLAKVRDTMKFEHGFGAT